MFWWLCGDFSNMRGAIFGKSKPHHHDDCGKQKEAIDEQQFASIFTYNTAVNYASNKYGAFDDLASTNAHTTANMVLQDENPSMNRWVEYTCAALSSTLLVLTLPFSLFFTLKFVGPFERLVVMRLGRARHVYGQGAVLLLPLVDKAKTVDLRVTSVELPPINICTSDRGIVEVIAVVYSKVSDPLTVCCALQNADQTLNSLAYTTLTRHLTKRMLTDITSPTSLNKILINCQEELNDFIRPHGIIVERLTVNNLHVLKPAENAAVSVFQTILKSGVGKQLMGQMSAHLCSTSTAATTRNAMNQQKNETISSSMNGLQALPELIISTETDKTTPSQSKTKQPQPPMPPLPEIQTDSELEALIARIRQCLGVSLVQRVGKHFRVLCTETDSEFDIDLRADKGWCGWTWERGASTPPDVHFTLDKRTLIALVDGTLSPMTAYLDGLVQIQGSIQDAISLRHLAECAAEIPTIKKIN